MATGVCKDNTFNHCWHPVPVHPNAAAPMFHVHVCCHCGQRDSYVTVPVVRGHGPHAPK